MTPQFLLKLTFHSTAMNLFGAVAGTAPVVFLQEILLFLGVLIFGEFLDITS